MKLTTFDDIKAQIEHYQSEDDILASSLVEIVLAEIEKAISKVKEYTEYITWEEYKIIVTEVDLKDTLTYDERQVLEKVMPLVKKRYMEIGWDDCNCRLILNDLNIPVGIKVTLYKKVNYLCKFLE